MAPLSGNELCFVADTDAEPTNTFTAGQIVTNQVKLYDLSGAERHRRGEQLRRQDPVQPARPDIAGEFNVDHQRRRAGAETGRGTKGSNLNPAGTMKYIADGQYFAFDVITTNANWDVNTLGDSTFYRATVTVTPKPACTRSTVGTGAVRLDRAVAAPTPAIDDVGGDETLGARRPRCKTHKHTQTAGNPLIVLILCHPSGAVFD